MVILLLLCLTNILIEKSAYGGDTVDHGGCDAADGSRNGVRQHELRPPEVPPSWSDFRDAKSPTNPTTAWPEDLDKLHGYMHDTYGYMLHDTIDHRDP